MCIFRCEILRTAQATALRQVRFNLSARFISYGIVFSLVLKLYQPSNEQFIVWQSVCWKKEKEMDSPTEPIQLVVNLLFSLP